MNFARRLVAMFAIASFATPALAHGNHAAAGPHVHCDCPMHRHHAHAGTTPSSSTPAPATAAPATH